MSRKAVDSIGKAAFNVAQARARVNRFLLSQVGSQFCAGDPEPDAQQQRWRVPILLVTPGFVAGPVGEADVNFNTREIVSHTAIAQIHASANKLRKRHHAAIGAAFIRTGKG